MHRKKLPKSIKKFIRLEKARIRRQVFSSKERSEMINILYQKFTRKPTENQPVKAVPLQEKVQIQTKGKIKKVK